MRACKPPRTCWQRPRRVAGLLSLAALWLAPQAAGAQLRAASAERDQVVGERSTPAADRRPAIPAWRAGARPGSSERSQALRERRRELWREQLEKLPPDERRELRRRMRERFGSRAWHRERGRQDGVFDGLSNRRDGELKEGLRELAPEERRRLWHTLRELRELPEGERRQLRERYRALQERPPEQRERLRENARRWREMSPDVRRELRAKMRALRALPAEDRLHLLEERLRVLEGLVAPGDAGGL